MGGDISGQISENSTFTFQRVRYHVVTKRWGILALTCCIMLLDLFTVTFFSFINDVASMYFHTEPIVIDLQATLNMIGRIMGVILVSIFGHWMTVRNMAVFGTATSTFSSLLIIVGVAVRRFAFVAIGTFSSGCASGVLLPLIILVPTNWFPPKEHGKANGASWATRRLSLVISSFLATRGMSISYAGGDIHTQSLDSEEMEYITNRFKTLCYAVFSSLALLSTTCGVLSKIYIDEHPPSVSDAFVAEDNAKSRESSPLLPKTSSYSFKGELKNLKCLLTNPSFLVIVCVFAFQMTELSICVILATSLILKEFPQTNDQFIGVILCIGVTASAVLSPITGQILDKLSKPRVTFLCLISISIAALASFSVFFKMHNVIGVFSAFIALWSMRDSLLVCTTHRLSAIMSGQPQTTRIKAFSIPSMAAALLAALCTTMSRILLENYGSAIGVLFPMPFLISCAIFYIFLWSYISHGQ